MLTNVNVKNLALIDSADIFFSDGFNVLSGETGAGKSILLGAIHLALGGKFSKEMMRKDQREALSELTFSIDNDYQRNQLQKLDVSINEDTVILTRKIVDGRSISRINGESASIEKLKNTASILLDLHTQQEHQSLLFQKKQLDILDSYGMEEIKETKEKTLSSYNRYKMASKDLEGFTLDENEKARELSLLEFEIKEIEDASIIKGEDEELEKTYKLLSSSKTITESLFDIHALSGYEDGAGSLIGRACQSINHLGIGIDEKLTSLIEQLRGIDDLLNDFNRELSDAEQFFEFDGEKFIKTEDRLNRINHLKMKYGSNLEDIEAYLQASKKRLSVINDYDANLLRMKELVKKSYEEYKASCRVLTELRKRNAKSLSKRIYDELCELNFLKVSFDISIEAAAETGNGCDRVRFLISFNPGEELKPLEKVASGGELSRVMLAVKTVLADNDFTKTLLFDEVDAGISGITAQKVAEKLSKISINHQVICITHLPQIAAMADKHFLIEKIAVGNETLSKINPLDQNGEVLELARMLSGENITEAVRQNALDLKRMGNEKKRKFK